MKKLSVFLSVFFGLFIWFSFAAPTVLNPTYTVEWNDVRIHWTDNSDWWYVDINLQNPNTKDWLHFWTTKISDQVFTYTKQWDWDQNIWIIPGDWWDQYYLCVSPTGTPCDAANNNTQSETTITENTEAWTVNRTVIPVVPKTWPDGTLIGIILATLVIFGGYIYIKKRADI